MKCAVRARKIWGTIDVTIHVCDVISPVGSSDVHTVYRLPECSTAQAGLHTLRPDFFSKPESELSGTKGMIGSMGLFLAFFFLA